MKKIILTILLFILPLACFAQEAANQAVPVEAKQPLTLTIKSDKEVYEVGEEIKLEATIRNNSDKETIIFWNDIKPASASGGGGTSLIVLTTAQGAYPIYIKPKESVKKIVVAGIAGSDGPAFTVTGPITSNTITIEVVEKKEG